MMDGCSEEVVEWLQASPALPSHTRPPQPQLHVIASASASACSADDDETKTADCPTLRPPA